jgi:hypothetical protein
MFYGARAFNQDIDSLDILSLTNEAGMFKGTAMTVDNMGNTLRGWAKLDILEWTYTKLVILEWTYTKLIILEWTYTKLVILEWTYTKLVILE